jgi:hypothetical protein
MLGKSVLRRRHECENDLVTVQENTRLSRHPEHHLAA